jgi:hypothetical protein
MMIMIMKGRRGSRADGRGGMQLERRRDATGMRLQIQTNCRFSNTQEKNNKI